ncbi:MAG: hypothetical protein LKJ17_12090 [Oscillospiraceae bacterium]|jgi:hypothetical protein|nr:hypothetical protein [Oscillospiraceae bacterium]
MQIYPNTLKQNSVSIHSDEYGVRAYVNSVRGRTQLESECPVEIVQKVEDTWGNEPTVTEPAFPQRPINTQPTATE